MSYGSELSNRAPTFDMDMSDFMDGEKPITYQKAKEYFARDPSQRWDAFMCMIFFDCILISSIYVVTITGGQHILQGRFWF